MTLVHNKKAHLMYHILHTFEAGAVLTGQEVKSLRAGRGKLEGGRVVVRGGEAFVVGISIPAFQPKNADPGYDAERPRKLLLNGKEIRSIYEAESTKGLTCIPISWYNKRRHLKLSVAIAKGKKKEDQRATIRAREEKKRSAQLLKRRS